MDMDMEGVLSLFGEVRSINRKHLTIGDSLYLRCGASFTFLLVCFWHENVG